jgi:hypothetical protein
VSLDRAHLARALRRAQSGPPERLAALESLVSALLLQGSDGSNVPVTTMAGGQVPLMRGAYSESFDRKGGQTG